MKVLSICDVLAHTRNLYRDMGMAERAEAVTFALGKISALSGGDSDDEPMTKQQMEEASAAWEASDATRHEKRAFIVTEYRTEHLEAVPSSRFRELVYWLQTGEKLPH
mgnify:CR=1 FL=1